MIERGRVEGIVFDLDGTLMKLRGGQKGGSLAGWLRPVAPWLPGGDAQAAARRFFVVTETPTNYLLAVMDRTGLMTRLAPLVDRARVAKGIGTLGNLHPIEGVPMLLPRLAARFPLAVLTNRARRETYGFLEANGLRECFGAVTTRQDLWRFKPHPEAVRRSARLLDVAPERLLMVGDMPVDMLTARRAGAQALGVLTGFATEAELRAAGADAVTASVTDMVELLDLPREEGEPRPGGAWRAPVNPFTRFLRTLRPIAEQEEVAHFVAWWDAVEAIVVEVNKRGAATDEERATYADARAALLRDYPTRWAPRFAPHWPATREAGRATPADPFPRILAPATADGFAQNWPAMQALASARETLNRYILALEE